MDERDTRTIHLKINTLDAIGPPQARQFRKAPSLMALTHAGEHPSIQINPSLTHNAAVFDPIIAGEIMQELALKAMPPVSNADAQVLTGLTAVDGSYFNSIAHTAWALWSTAANCDYQHHRRRRQSHRIVAIKRSNGFDG